MEEPLPPNGVCNLGHLNLPMFLVRIDGRWQMDWEALARAVEIAVRFQDNIVDYSSYFDDDIEAVQLGDRRIGIGTMGLATVLIRLGIPYGSDAAIKFSEALNQLIAKTAYKASMDLGFEKGSFPNYDLSRISKDSFLYRLNGGTLPGKLRNAALLTQAPTGSTGTLIDNLPGYNCSTGIEPYFAFKYFRASRLGLNEQEVELVAEYRKQHPGEELPGYFISADEIVYREHVQMQGAIQKYVDAAISKTINLPEHATVEDVKQAYLLAYEVGCKGVTVYRDGSRKSQVLARDKEKARLDDVKLSTDYAKKDAEFTVKLAEVFAAMPELKPFKKRARILYGKTVKQSTPMGKMYVTLNSSDGINIEEVFIHLGKVGSDIRAIVDALGILLTLGLSDRLSALDQEEKLKWLIDKLVGIKGANPTGLGPSRVDSLPDALGRVLKDYLTEDFALDEESELEVPETEVKYAHVKRRDICTDCGEATLVRVEGCEKCLNPGCGASKCS